MSTGLAAYALKFFSDPEAVKREVTCPMLVWEKQVPSGTDVLLTTMPGVVNHVPRSGEPLVIPLRKTNNKGNAFGLGVTVGRTENNDVVIADHSISRFHGYFLQDTRTQAWKLVDAESKNGTWVNGVRLGANRPESLTSRARLRFGQVDVIFYLPEDFIAHLRQISGT